MTVLRDIEVLDAVERAPLPERIARQPALARLRRAALERVRSEALLQCAACWHFVPLDAKPDAEGHLCLDGRTLQAPWLLPESGRLTGRACAVVTLGPRLEALVSRLFEQQQRSLAVALDAVGNQLLFELSRRVQDRMALQARREGLTMAGELRAGDPGLALEAQATVLHLAQAFSIGVTLCGSAMMNPAKSLSLVQGIGHGLPAVRWSRCDHCPSQARCALARGHRATLAEAA